MEAHRTLLERGFTSDQIRRMTGYAPRRAPQGIIVESSDIVAALAIEAEDTLIDIADKRKKAASRKIQILGSM